MSEKVKNLHERCSKLNSTDLILVILQLSMTGPPSEDLYKIMKTYLFRALKKEGFQ